MSKLQNEVDQRTRECVRGLIEESKGAIRATIFNELDRPVKNGLDRSERGDVYQHVDEALASIVKSINTPEGGK